MGEQKRVLGAQEGEEQEGAAACGERSENPKIWVAWRWGLAPGEAEDTQQVLNVAVEIGGLGKNERGFGGLRVVL